MEKSTVIGVIVGILTLVIGITLKGSSVAVLLNPAALVIILVGTTAALFNAFSMERLKKFPVICKLLFKEQKLISKIELVKVFIELAQTARREGLLSLESRIEEIKDPFFQDGMRMVIDGLDADFVQDVLTADIHAMEERHQSYSLIFSQAGMYAPTLGVLGAVMGLIAALGNLNDMEKLGHSIAAAFVATLLGIFTGYVLWHPFANKLKLKSKDEAEIKKMIVEGILSIQAGDSPVAIEAKLVVFIPQQERLLLKAKSEG